MNVLSYYADTMDVMLITYLISGIIGIGIGCVFGFITKTINEANGYYGGFAWGFWLGVIGIIIVACRQPNPYAYQSQKSIIKKEPTDQIPPEGGWKCSCGRVHAKYVSSCPCGKSKSDAIGGKGNREKANIEALKEYKALLDQGVITQEEFDRKKQEILSR